MSLLSTAQDLSGRRSARASITSHLPHWSEVEPDATRRRPAPNVAAVLRDLVSWGADIAIRLTRGCPEDHEAIERVRRAAYAWLANEPCPDVGIDDVLTTAAAIMSGIDRNLGGTVPGDDHDERCAIGAAVPA
jgi:hypothetical protein